MALVADEQSIPLAYTFSREDYVALVVALGQPPRQQVLRLLAAWLIVVVGLAVVLASSAQGDFSDNLLAFVQLRAEPAIIYPIIAGVLVLALLAPLLTRLQARRLYKHLSSAGKSISGTLDATGAHTAMAGIQSHLDWSIIQRVIVTEEHLFLAFTKHEALVIPKRAFEGPQALDAALALAASKVPAK